MGSSSATPALPCLVLCLFLLAGRPTQQECGFFHRLSGMHARWLPVGEGTHPDALLRIPVNERQGGAAAGARTVTETRAPLVRCLPYLHSCPPNRGCDERLSEARLELTHTLSECLNHVALLKKHR